MASVFVLPSCHWFLTVFTEILDPFSVHIFTALMIEQRAKCSIHGTICRHSLEHLQGRYAPLLLEGKDNLE